MAKTLIGNIRGKDGRGIVSINKTGTTGSVDTYTITYTDSSTSTFTVNNSDSIALQRQIVPSAAVESSSTASQAYAAGDYVVVNGLLRKVKAAIAKGNAISDSNSTATTVTGELATIVDSVSMRWQVPYSSSSITLCRVGGVVMANGNVKFDYSGQNNYTTVVNAIPDGFRPAHDQCIIQFESCGFSLLVNQQGRVQALGDPAGAYATASGCWITYDKRPTE